MDIIDKLVKVLGRERPVEVSVSQLVQKGQFLVYDYETSIGYFSGTFYDPYSNCYALIEMSEYDGPMALYEFFDNLLYGPNKVTLIGFNNMQFDDPLTNYLLKCQKEEVYLTTEKIYKMANYIISASNRKLLWRDTVTRELMYYDRNYESIDLYQLFNTVDRKSLKRFAVSIKWPLVQDMPYPHDVFYNEQMKEETRLYNLNDVMLTAELMFEMHDEILQRRDISKMYGINVMNSSRADMGRKLMIKMFEEASGMNYRDFKDFRTYYDWIHFRELISDKIYFQSKQLNDLVEKIKNKSLYIGQLTNPDNVVTKEDDDFHIDFQYGDTFYRIAKGGLHSIHKEDVIFRPREGYTYIDVDVDSFYPNVMVNEKIFPKHLGEIFLTLLKKIIVQRIAAKKLKKVDQVMAVVAEALKISINSLFGKMGFKRDIFYDLKAMYGVTINGQLMLIMLIEALENAGIKVFYANTDGITAEVHESQKELFDKICKWWQDIMNLNLEKTLYKELIIDSVNSYSIRYDDNGKDAFKKKGSVFLLGSPLGKDDNYKIVAEALHYYFHYNIPVSKTIRDCTDIHKFILSNKIGPSYKGGEFVTVKFDDNNTRVTVREQTQRTNRYFVSTSTGCGKLYKVKEKKGVISRQEMLSGEYVKMLNTPDDFKENFSEYGVHYDFYIRKAREVVDSFYAFESQMDIFDVIG